MKFRVRVDGKSDEEFCLFLSKMCKNSSVVLVHHVLPHGNPHHHAMIEDGMVMSVDTFRKRVSRYFNVKGSDYSVKICDDDKVNEYVQYMFNTKHGNVAKLVYVNNFSQNTLDDCIAKAKEVTDEFAKSVEEAKKKNKTISAYDLGIRVYEMMQDSHNENPTIEDWTKMTIKVCHDARKTCEPNQLIRIISTAISKYDVQPLVKKVQNYFQMI